MNVNIMFINLIIRITLMLCPIWCQGQANPAHQDARARTEYQEKLVQSLNARYEKQSQAYSALTEKDIAINVQRGSTKWEHNDLRFTIQNNSKADVVFEAQRWKWKLEPKDPDAMLRKPEKHEPPGAISGGSSMIPIEAGKSGNTSVPLKLFALDLLKPGTHEIQYIMEISFYAPKAVFQKGEKGEDGEDGMSTYYIDGPFSNGATEKKFTFSGIFQLEVPPAEVPSTGKEP